jgi:NAD(P)-dependent dehydrogenase (short-subunit alcohol dehydrogenase family)
MEPSSTSGGVLITGASTGSGAPTALRLDKAGFQVFAGVRKPEDGERLRAAGVTVVQPLDVTKAEDVAAAVQTVESALGGRPLRGIVNNAGIGIGGPLEALDLDDFRRTVEVNTTSQLAVTKAFLPLLRKSHGRIVNMSSIGGRVAQPFAGPYIASKFALEGVTDVLRGELLEWGIDVIAIEPGTIATPIWEKSSREADDVLAKLTPEQRDLYGKRLAKMTKVLARQGKRGASPEKVADAVEKALTAKRPKPRYLVGDAHVLINLKRILPTRWFDRLLYRMTS